MTAGGYITASEAAEKIRKETGENFTPDDFVDAATAGIGFGLSRSWVSRLARHAYDKSNLDYPKKVGRTWVATLNQWELIVHPPDKAMRPKRRQK
ncbi:hypothetical protein C8P63_12629 [Melghirimyces profundicolus]|uniref:Uncharacterized protein n=2 Tax=Melghirimyces profundicolus TaxID=1242148 RepID=A0A2T6BCG4_9BACL|nr:hypothetical protein C8P63_12629 [Melghirimyces profundicolus]